MITTVTLNASIDKAYHMTEKIENGTVDIWSFERA